MTHSIISRPTCRVCGARRLTQFITLPRMPLVDNLLRREEIGNEFIADLTLSVCEECGLAQTRHDVNAADYYRDYQYSVALSGFAQQFMRRLAEQIWHTYNLRANDVVIEIGSSDGAQLAHFQSLGMRVLGFEPSALLARAAQARGVPTIQQLFDANSTREIPSEFQPTQVILLAHTFDHIPEPMSVLEAVRRTLDPARGVLVIEVHDLAKTVARREFCLFAHEHTTYYYDASIQHVLRRAGFELISTDVLPLAEQRGNSLFAVAALPTAIYARNPMADLPRGALGQAAPLIAFGQSVAISLARLREFVRAEKQRGVRLAGYGAGGRGVMTLAAVAQPGDVAYVCDKNPRHNGFYTPGSHVPVYTPEHLLTDPVDRVIVFSFGYFQEIYDELAEFRRRGGELISLLDLL